MKYKYLLLAILISTFSFAQEKAEDPKTKSSEKSETNKEDKKEKVFVEVDYVPVYKNCDESLDNEALKQCISNEINLLIKESFNTDIGNEIGVNGRQRIYVRFTINEEGVVEKIKVKAKHIELEKEARRVFKLIPKFKKPAFKDKKPVSVSYDYPITFSIH